MARLPERHQEDVLRSHLSETGGTLKPKVVFQGERGANSERAIMNYFPEGEVDPTALPGFEDIFNAVLSKEANWGMLPIENTLAGSVLDNYDLLTRYPDVKIVGEIKVRIQHNLIVVPDGEESMVKKVYSHPQALSQCAKFIKKKGWESVPFFDTAGAAAMVCRKKDASLAAIASTDAAAYHGLKILAEGIETNPRNYTRFAIIAHQDTPEPENSDKVSFTITLKSHPGTLVDCLSALKDYKVNMTKLESRPIAGKPWSYMFYVDAMLPEKPGDFDTVEKILREVAEDYRRLGTYRAG